MSASTSEASDAKGIISEGGRADFDWLSSVTASLGVSRISIILEGDGERERERLGRPGGRLGGPMYGVGIKAAIVSRAGSCFFDGAPYE